MILLFFFGGGGLIGPDFGLVSNAFRHENKNISLSWFHQMCNVQNCDEDRFELTTTSNINPSSDSIFSEKQDLCYIIAKIDKICQVYFNFNFYTQT